MDTKVAVEGLRDVLCGWSKKSQEMHKDACRARKLRDANRIAEMAGEDTLKQAARKAKIDLKKAVHTMYAKDQFVPDAAHGPRQCGTHRNHLSVQLGWQRRRVGAHDTVACTRTAAQREELLGVP